MNTTELDLSSAFNPWPRSFSVDMGIFHSKMQNTKLTTRHKLLLQRHFGSVDVTTNQHRCYILAAVFVHLVNSIFIGCLHILWMYMFWMIYLFLLFLFHLKARPRTFLNTTVNLAHESCVARALGQRTALILEVSRQQKCHSLTFKKSEQFKTCWYDVVCRAKPRVS